MQAAAGRAGGSAAARTGRPQGLEAARGAARRDRACEPADHRARPADLPHGPWPADGAAGCVSDPEGRKRAAGRNGPPTPSAQPAPDEWIRRLGTLPLMHQPGERWLYHTGSDVLGVLIARASGQPWRRFCVNASLSRSATFPSAGGGLVSTIDDYLAVCQMMLNKGNYGSERLLSRPSVETMTTDQLTPEQKAVSGFYPGYFDSRGWGFGVSVITRRDDLAAVPGRFGWDGGLGTSWYSDPREDMVAILMTQRSAFPLFSGVYLDFWTSAYQTIDD